VKRCLGMGKRFIFDELHFVPVWSFCLTKGLGLSGHEDGKDVGRVKNKID